MRTFGFTTTAITSAASMKFDADAPPSRAKVEANVQALQSVLHMTNTRRAASNLDHVKESASRHLQSWLSYRMLSPACWAWRCACATCAASPLAHAQHHRYLWMCYSGLTWFTAVRWYVCARMCARFERVLLLRLHPVMRLGLH